MDKDIIIIGAGACGLMAAKDLAAAGYKVTVLEARSRIGGRIHTIRQSSFTGVIEEGAEFVHGRLPLTLSLLKDANAAIEIVEGRLFEVRHDRVEEEKDFVKGSAELNKQIEKLGVDMTVDEFLDTYFAGPEDEELRNATLRFIQGYEAADTSRASIKAMQKDLNEEEPEQYRIKEGYQVLADYLAGQCTANGGSIHLSAIAKQVYWEKGKVKVATHNGSEFTASRLLVTIPLGVLQTEGIGSIKFEPALPDKQQTISQLGFGKVVKVILEFTEPVWELEEVRSGQLKGMGFLFSDENFPTWWTNGKYSNGMITGWVGGPPAEKYTAMNKDEVISEAMDSLAVCLGVQTNYLAGKLKAAHTANWNADPFSLGAYKYSVVNSKQALAEMNKPVKGTIFFAGEALYEGPYTGTVEAALSSAVNVVKEILNS